MSYEVIGWLIAIVVFIAAEAATVALVSYFLAFSNILLILFLS